MTSNLNSNCLINRYQFSIGFDILIKFHHQIYQLVIQETAGSKHWHTISMI